MLRFSDQRFCPGSVVACLIFALLTPGCTSFAPPFERPAMPVAEQYPGNSDAPGSEEAAAVIAASTAWRGYFIDPRLQELIAQALQNNRDLKTAVLRVEEARAQYGIQRAEQSPGLAAGADASRVRSPEDLRFPGQPPISSQYQAGLSLTSWELDFWGRIANLSDAALANFLSTDYARRAATIALIAQVANDYLVLRELDERLVLARQTIANHERSLRLFQQQYASGATSRFDVVQVETLLAQALALGASLEQSRARQANALTLAVGSNVDLSPSPYQVDDKAILRELRAGLPSDLLIDRPDIMAAEQGLRAANANIGAARAAFFPRITLIGSLGTASSDLSGLFGGDSKAWSFLPHISIPIFDAGRNRASLDLAQVRRDMAVVKYEKTIQTAFREVSDALAARKWLDQQVVYQEAALKAQSERSRIAQLRYDSGAAAYLEVLDAQRDLLNAQQQLVQIRRARLTSRVGLYAALGGGGQDLAAGARPAIPDTQ